MVAPAVVLAGETELEAALHTKIIFAATAGVGAISATLVADDTTWKS